MPYDKLNLLNLKNKKIGKNIKIENSNNIPSNMKKILFLNLFLIYI